MLLKEYTARMDGECMKINGKIYDKFKFKKKNFQLFL